MMDSVVKIKHLSKKFKFYEQPYHRIVEWVTNGKIKKHQELCALKDINLEVKRGECVGIIGPNGAGKSTLLKILSKALRPSSGFFEVHGNLVSLLELGTGFHPELSGIENIFNSGRILGFSEAYLKGKLEDIINFAELGEFIHHPVKTYSSGMYVRLAFSLFANLEPDVYIVDEALSVGDIFFQQKCFAFLEKLKQQGTAIIVVSHDTQVILKYCDRVLILNNGEISHLGNPVAMVNLYYSLSKAGGIPAENDVAVEQNVSRKNISQERIEIRGRHNVENGPGIRRGNGKVKIVGAHICNHYGEEKKTAVTGDDVSLELYVKANSDVDDLALGFQITDRLNTVVFGQTSYMATRQRLWIKKNEYLGAAFRIKLNLFEGLYTIAVCATDCQLEVANEVYDWIEGCLLIEVIKPEWRSFHGIAALDTGFELLSRMGE